jgi:hypothetical protein
MKLIPFEVSHLDQVVLAEFDEIQNIVGTNAKQLFDNASDNYMAMTGVDDDDEVVFIVGVNQLWPKVYEAWLFVSTKFYKLKLSSIKLIKTLLYDLKVSIGFNRVQADIRADITKNIDFIKFFGFNFEGRMLKYGLDGETYLRFAIYGD